MPFDDSFNDIYVFGIKQTCAELNAYCERVDEQIFSERILDRIYNQIGKADIIIADMTNCNPNVFYEVGYAHALGKNVILLTQNSDDIPFDLKHFPHIIYNGKIKTLSTQLKTKLDWFLNQETIVGTYHQVSRKHLGRYLHETSFRYNNRALSCGSLFDLALANGVNKRIDYKTLVNGKN